MFTRALSDGGMVVGSYTAQLSNTELRPGVFLWDAASGTRTLDDVVPGWRFRDARAVNASGQILATGRPDGSDRDEFVVVTLATVPEPATWALFAGGLAVLAGWSAVRRRPT
jgi:hypothetical protein